MGKGGGKKALSVLGFAFGAGWLGGGVQFGMASSQYLMAGLYGASLGSTIWGVMHPPKTPGAEYSRFDTIMNTVSSTATIPVVYGVRRWGGNQAWHKVEDDNKRVIKDIIICEGEIEGIYDVRANDVKIGGLEDKGTLIEVLPTLPKAYIDRIVNEQGKNHVNNCSFSFKNGAKNQDPPDNWDVVGGYKNCAWLRATLNLSEKLQGGNPTITMLVKGKKVWVYRRDWNNGGSSTYKWFYEWSDNPVWCTYDFVTNRRYGLGRYVKPEDFDLDALVESAEYCNEYVTSWVSTVITSVSQIDDKISELQYTINQNPNGDNTALQNEITNLQLKRQDFINGQTGSLDMMVCEKRYTMNMILDQTKNAIEVLGEMLSNFGGFLVWNDDTVALRIEKSTLSSYDFTDDTIIKDSMEITMTPLEETPNKYTVGYFDPLNNWTQIKVLMEDTGDQRERDHIINKDVTLSGVISQSQALRLSRFFKDLNRVCPIVISFATATHAMHLECGDVVKVSWNNVFNGMPFRILEIADGGQGIFRIKARQYNDSIYNDDLGAEIQVKNYTTIPSPLVDVVPEVTDLSLSEVFYIQPKTGAIVSYIQGSCKIPAYQFLRHATIEYSDDSKKTWNYVGITLDGKFIIPNIKVGSTYYARVRVENAVARKSDGVVSTELNITGKNLPPSNVSGFAFQPVSGGFLLTWDSVSDPDIDGYDIYQGNDNSSMSTATRIANKLYSTSLFVPITKAGKCAFHIVAVDTSGNISNLPTTLIAEFNTPPDVVCFDVVVNGSDLDFRWQPIAQSGVRYEIRRGDAWGYGEQVGKTANSFYKTLFPASGSHDFWIKSIDSYGNYSDNAVKASISLLPQNDRNIVKTHDETLMGWQGTRINLDIVDGGLKMANLAIRGEYIAEINLPKTFLARNWIDSHVSGIAGQEIAWDMATFTWDSPEANSPWKSTGDIDGTNIKHQIAYWNGLSSSVIESFSLNGTTAGEKGKTPTESKGITYEDGRFRDGAKITDTSRLSYSVNIPTTFSTVFNVKVGVLKDSAVYLTLVGANGKLWFGYNSKTNKFFLKDNLQRYVTVDAPTLTGSDFITLGIVQTPTKRKIFIKTYSSDTAVSAEGDITPLGSFTAVYLYPYQFS